MERIKRFSDPNAKYGHFLAGSPKSTTGYFEFESWTSPFESAWNNILQHVSILSNYENYPSYSIIIDLKGIPSQIGCSNLVALPNPVEKKQISWIGNISPEDELEMLARLAQQSGASADIGIELSPSGMIFCYTNDLMGYLKTAMYLIRRHFPRLQKISSDFVSDPESKNKWVLLNVYVPDDISSILDNYQSYTKAWVSNVPWPSRSKIRVSCFPVEN